MMSCHIKFGTVEVIVNQKIGSLISAFKMVAQVYHRAGFRLTQALMDGEFKTMRGELSKLEIALNTTSCNEHVGDIEKYI